MIEDSLTLRIVGFPARLSPRGPEQHFALALREGDPLDFGSAKPLHDPEVELVREQGELTERRFLELLPVPIRQVAVDRKSAWSRGPP